MKSGKGYTKNLLLAATIVSLSTTMPMNVAYADSPTPTRGAYAAYTITNGTADNYNFTTSDGSTTSYYKTNLSVLNLLNNINGSTAWIEGSQDNNNFSVVLPNNETRYFIYGYTKPDGWGDGERQAYDYNGNAAGNSAFYNNRIFSGLNSNVSGGAIDIQAKYQATTGSNLVGTMTADFINNSITNTDTAEKGLGGALHIWGPYAGIETLNSNFINNHITYGTAKSGGGALAIGEGYNQGESTVGLINGNFINNYIDAPSYNLGGAIYYEGSGYGDGEITSIGQDPLHTTKFVGNHILGSGQGGAIYAVNKIGSIYADFIGNYIEGLSGESYGGAISLRKTSNEKTVGSITGDFIGNYITTSEGNGKAYGGAIYNNNSVGSITGDFIGNYVVSEQNDTYGGAVYNYRTITNLTSNFIGNYANGQDVYGGAIYNTGTDNGGTITNINGKFIENVVYSNVQGGFNAVGGAIANISNGIIENISGDFIRNKAHSSSTSSSMTATGGAIYNDGAKIGTINANFIENEAQREAGAIYNNGDSSYDKGIETISGNFIKNKVTSDARSTKGGAISNTGTITDITGTFANNTTQSSGNYIKAEGGAIYNSGSITTINANFTDNKVTQTGSNNYYDYDIAGGAIQNYGGTIGTVTGTFEDNSAKNDNSKKGVGGAINNFYDSNNTQITNINADFTSNEAYYGGAISNYSDTNNNSAVISSISGKTDGNKAQFTSNTAYNSGGAIYNNSSTINSLNADFTTNKVEGYLGENGVYSYGGAIYNKADRNTSTISNITGKFEGNYVSSISDGLNAIAFGGAILNIGKNSDRKANLNNITGSFVNNYAYAKNSFNTSAKQANARGGAIYNGAYGVIDAITVNFTGNYAKGETPNSATTIAEGGAIYNAVNGSIGYISGVTFGGAQEGKANYALANSTNGHAYGGAIYNAGTIGDIENSVYSISDSRFEGNYVSSPVAAFGGAIYSTSDLYIKNTDFVNNKAIVQYDQNSKGGAIYQDGGTLLLEDSSFTGNIADKGAAIYANNTNVTVYAKTENVEFTNNNSTGAANGSGTGIYLYGGSLTLNAADGKYIAINDALNIAGNTTLNGTLKLGDNAVETLANTTSKFIAQGGTLDIANGAVDTMTFANAVDIQNAMNLGIDVNLTGTTAAADKITADITSGNTSPITISAINFIHDNYTGSEEDHNLTIASGTIKSLINETVNPTVTGNTNTYSYSYDQDTGILTLTIATYNNIHEAVADDTKPTRTYKIKLAEGETVEHAIGAIAGATSNLTINGNNRYLDGKVGGVNQGGFIVADGQTLTLKNISQVKNFTTAVDNGGTLNVENVTFTGNTTDINNTATLNLSGINKFNAITGATGNTNINSGATTFTGAINQNEIAMKGGRITVNSGAVITADVKGYEDTPYASEDGTRAIYNNNGTISNITGVFKGNSAALSTTSNIKGGVLYTKNGTVAIDSATFDGNSVKGSSGGYGGAIYSSGTALTITGTSENPTVFKNNGISKYDNNYQGSASGGAIYQTGETLNISNAKFENNVSDFNIKSNSYGGAIYTEATGGNISADFTGNTLSATGGSGQGGAIYNLGTLTKITGDFTNNAITLQPTSSTEQYGESIGGAIYNRYMITDGIEGTFSGNTITTNVKQSDANGGAIANGGTIGDITGDFLNNAVTSTNTTYSGSARGGAIYNLSGTIGNITATNATENGFKGNSATKAAGYNAEGLGGAIYNHAEGYDATIGNITADFINNTATTNGGAIYNYAADNNKAEIGNIIGNFIGNTAYLGSAIYNYVKNDQSYIDNKLAKIGNITGNFSENTGTVIYNKGYYDSNNFNETVYAEIGDITGNFADNNSSGGNVIFNDYAKIGDITGDFTENITNNGVINNSGSIDSITANATNQKGFYQNTGGAIRNYASESYHRNATIGNIIADFKENSASGYSGAAINNTSANANLKAKIGNITGNFDQNASTNYGGAIYNSYGIIGTQNNLSEFTGTAITGNFTNNQVTNNSVANPSGGAITNENSSAIGNIQGNFENNSIINSNYKAMGGAIANRNSSTIGNITGNFNANTVSYNPIFDTDTFRAEHYGDYSLGGAIYNDSTSTIGTLTGDFVGNWAKGHVAEDDTTTVFAAAGGAIYNEGTLGTITGDIINNYALGHSHHGVYGGAIYTTTGLNLVDSDITGNYVITQSTSATDLKGGAIYTTDGINITASTKDISVSGNYGTQSGAAIYNSSTEKAVVINATGGNITFENNNLTGLSNGSGVGIYSTGGLTVNSASNKYVSLNDALNIVGNTTLNGTLKLGDNAVETLANTTSKFIAQGGALDIANGAIDTMTFANAVDIQNAINLGLDVNLTGTTATADKITADFTTGNTSAITLSALNFINDNYTGSEEEHELTIASGTIKSLINENITSTTGNTNTYTYSYDQNTGILTVSLVTYDNIYDAVHDTEKATRTYKIKLAEGETITQALGALAGTKLTVNGNNKYLDGASKGGITVANGQTLELKNISQVKNFTTAVDNAGTLNVEGVTFTSNTTDVNNTATLNLSGSNTINTITGATGNTNINGGATWIKGGSVTQNTINLKGGDLVLALSTSLPLTPGTITANIVGDGTVEKTGIILNSGTINGTISGIFKGNNNTALANYGTVGNITADFVNNTATVLSSNAKGGAIYNEGGTLGTISGNFTGNSATSSSGNAYGGAIYQSDGTLTISNSTFGGSETGQGNSATSSASGKYGYGGAIYLTNATATITDSIFEKNSAMWGGAIYQNSGSLTLNNATFKNNTGNIGSSIYQKSGTLSITGSTFDNTNSGNLWQESGNLSITGSNFTNTDVTSRLGSNVTITGSTFDNSPVHFLGKGNETSASYQNTFSIVNSTIQNVTASHSNAYALSVCGGDVTIDGVNIINNTNARGIKSEAAAQYGDFTTRYSKLNIIAQTADVNITGNKEGIYVVGWNNDDHFHTTLSLYAKNHDILISGNTDRGLSYYDQYGSLTLNADTGHNITINDTVDSNVGMTINADNNAGTVALNGALTLGSALNVNGGTLTLNDTAASSMANKDLVLNGGALKLDSVAAAAIVNTKLGLNGGIFDIANNNIDDLTFANAINNAANSYLALDVSLGDTNTADKITSDITGASTIYLSDLNFIFDNKNGGEVQIADGNIKSAIAVSDIAGGYADVQYDNTTGVLSFADKIDWLQQTNGSQSGYRFTKTNNGIMPVNYTSGENNYTFYTDILRKNYVDNNSVAHDLKYTWDNSTHLLSVTNSDDTAVAQTTMGIVGAGSTADPYILTGDYTGNSDALGFAYSNRIIVESITGDFIRNTNGAVDIGMRVTVNDITGNFIGNTKTYDGGAVHIDGTGEYWSRIDNITGDFIGNSSTSGAGGAIATGFYEAYNIGTVTGDFISNSAVNGGAVYVASGSIDSLVGDFVNNYASNNGGAVFVGGSGSSASITLSGDFIGNTAANAGGAVYNNQKVILLNDTSFIGNKAPEGAAIYNNQGTGYLVVTAQNKDIEFTNNNSTGAVGGEGYGIYSNGSFDFNAYENKTITVNDKVYSTGNINLNYDNTYNGTIVFNNVFNQTGGTNVNSGTAEYNGATSLGALSVSGANTTLKLGSGAGTSSFGAVTFTNTPTLDLQNNAAQTLNVASIKNNANLNIDIDFTGGSVIADAINIATGGQTGTLTINSITALASDSDIREFTNLAILTGETDGVTLALSDAIQQDPRFNGDAVETITWESDYTDTATFANTVFTNTEYSETKQKHLYVVDGTKLSFDETTTIPKHATGNVTTQDVLQALNQSTSATRTLTTDDADATYTVGDNLGATGTGSLSVTGTTSGENTSTLNMNGKLGFELSNSDTTLALSNLNITGIKDVEGGLINITGENSSATLTSVNIGGTTNSAIVNNKTLNLAGNTTINTGIKGSGTMNVNGNVALNGALTLSGTTNVTGGTLKLGTAAAGSAFNNIAFSNTPTLDLQNTTIDTLNVDKITGNSNLNIDVNYASSLADTIQIATTGSSGTITVDSLNFLGGSVPTSFNVYVLTQGTEGDISGITLAISDALAAQYNDPTPTSEDYIKPYTYESNINFDKTDFTSEKWTRTTQKQLTVVDNTTSKGLNLNVNEISNEHKAGGAEDTHYDALQVLNQHEGTRTLKADGATANTYTVGDNLGTTATGTLNVTGKSSGSNLDMNNKTGFVVSNADTTLNLSNLNITNVSDTADGGLVTVSGTGSKANLENVTIASTTNSAISNAVELNLSGTNNLGTGIVGAAGTTNITGGKTTVGSIAQNGVNITAGELEVANITATNGIFNDGTLTLTGTSNTNVITGNGHTVIASNINNTGSISQAITVNGSKTLNTAANLIGGAVTNSGTVELTGGALGQTITGGGITIASGEVTSTVANLGGDITNDATLNLSGTLDKNIAGTEGITKLADNMTFADGAGVAGTLNFNGKAITMSGDDATSTFNIGKINSDGTINIDVNTSGSPVSDVINITTAGSTGTITINSINEIGARGDNFTLNVLQGTTGGLQLALSDAVQSQFNQEAQHNLYYVSDAYQANIDFDKTSFDTAEWDRVTQKTIGIEDNTKITYATHVISDTATGNVTQKDALAFINQNTDTSAVADRSMVTSDTNKTYTVQEDLGTTGAGTLLVQGASDKTTKLDMNNHSGFVVANSGTAVTLKDINVDNVQNTDGGLVNITNTGSSATLDGAVVNVKDNPENKANVISSNGTLGVTNSTVNAGVNNNGTMNLNGTNQIASVEGSNGTANVQAGTTTVGSIFQKLINIVTGGKLASNGDVTATNGITNDTANGLSVANGTLTGNVTGSGSTDFKGTSAIADGSTVGQAITVVDGKLTTLADGLGGAVTNGGEVDLTGGTLETSITGGNTTISGNVGVDDTLGSIASAVKVETDAKLTTNASNVKGAINNGGDLDLTGGDIKNTISGDGTTTISGTVTNSTGSTIGNTVTIAATGDLTTAADKLGGAVANGGTVQLDGGTLGQTITGGNISIIDDVDTNASNLAGATTVASSKELTLTGGDVNSNISGVGDTKITASVNNNANISTATEVAGGALDNTNGQLADVTVTSGSLKSNADNVGAVANNGTYEITGGTIASGNGISGTGNINITGNVINNATNTTTGAVTVGAGNELKIGATGDVFGTASSVTMGDNSTLNLQNGSAVATNINNVVVGADDTLNLALDWGDQVNTTNPSNIAGNLQISSVDLTGTDGSKQTYQITTTDGIKDKISIKDPLDIQGTGVSNFVKYNDRPASANYGQLTTYQNSLFMAVTDTEVGEIATYNMITDETAGGGELDGTLKVQGNGHSITTGGVVIGSTTIQNAELTLEDANMRNITGDAITVYGGNKGHIVANAHDVAITANTGNAIKLIANGTNYAEMDIDAGSKTVTIDNDIVSDDSNNKVTFKGGTINFNGKFDPAMGVVGGATVNRGGDDDGIDWTVTSGTLNYLQDSYLNRATNTMNLNGGTLNTVNGVVTDFALGGFTLSNDSNFYADVDLAAGKMDNFISTPTTYTGGTLHVAGLNLISDATADNTSIPFANSTLAGHVDYTGAQGLTALSPIYKYNVGYNSSNGNFDFVRYNSGGYDSLNPAIMAAPVAAQMGGYLTQLNSYDEAFRNMDMYMLMTAQQRQALKNKNKIASLDGGILYDQTLMRQERAEGWFRPFATFEKVPLKNGPKVENIAYGTYMGGESEMYDLGHGWDGIWGAYVGYNGSHQNYDGVSIYQNGGTLGVLGMAYKGNFFTGLTINAGASGVEASTMYGNEDFAMLMAGIASKTGYNWELFNGKFIIQPSMLMSYSFVNTFDYKNAAGVNVDSDPLHAIQLQPELKFIGNLKNGWQPYASVAMVWNIMDNTKFKANDVSLPELSVKPYVKYGVGVRKTWGERFTGFFQTYLTNGGRNGVGLQAGFTWAFGGGKDKKADEKKIQKSLNKTPELKKTEIVLNGKKVQ